MKEEIKEILDNLRIYAGREENGFICDIEDYITNLQEQLHQASLDIQELTEKDIGCPSWCDKLTNLQEENINCDKEYTKLIYKYNKLLEENERYKKIFEGKERFSKIMPDDIDFIIMSKTDYDRQVDDIELIVIELRNRIDKALDYLETFVEVDVLVKGKMVQPAINILKGDDKE